MIDPKTVAKLDQGMELLREVAGKSLFSLFTGCCQAGFSEAQAMQITLAATSALFSTGIKAASDEAKKSDGS